jgi:hypothetical protein
VRLYVDLETNQLIEGRGFRNPVSSLRFKRGDAARLEVEFLRNGTTPVTIGEPASLSLQFGVKPRGRYDIGYLVQKDEWTLPDPGSESPTYQCSPSFNTVELDSALNVGSSTGSELSEITLMGEITWREGLGEPTSTRTFIVVVENDVNRGTEGVPIEAEPAYPTPAQLAPLILGGEATAAGIQALSADDDRHRIYQATDTGDFWLIPVGEPGNASVKLAIAGDQTSFMISGEATEATILALPADVTRHRIFKATDSGDFWLVPMGELGSGSVKIYPQAGGVPAPLVSLKLKSNTTNVFQISGGSHSAHLAPPVHHPTITHSGHNQYQRNFCGFCVHDPGEVADAENCWNTGTDTFTAPRTGTYRFTWSALQIGGLPDFVNSWGNLVWGGRVALRVNGSADYAVTTGNLDGSFASSQNLDILTLAVNLNAGDTVQIVTAFGRNHQTYHLPVMGSHHHHGQYGHRGPINSTLTIEEL